MSQAHGRVSLTALPTGWPQDTGHQVPTGQGGERREFDDWVGALVTFRFAVDKSGGANAHSFEHVQTHVSWMHTLHAPF